MIVLFPGQGSQAPKMGAYLFENFPIVKKTFEEASDAIGLNLVQLIFEGTEKELALTANTQPALLCLSVATYKVIQEITQKIPTAAAGHSIGEYAGLVASGSLEFSIAMKAVRLRGEAMQSAVPIGDGGMVAVLGLDDVQVKWLCDWAEKNSSSYPLSPANYNSPGQIVISGSQKTIEWLKSNFKPDLIPGEPKRAKLIPLNVSAPFHCLMMKPAEKKISDFFSTVEFRKPQFPIVQNVNAQLVDDPVELKKNIIAQVSAPVMWTQTMNLLAQKNWLKGIECGHGSVLKGLFKKFDSIPFEILSSQSQNDLDLVRETFNG